MDVATIMSTDSNLHKWAWIRAYLHTDEWTWLYHMSTDCNLRKWTWLTKEAELRYDV